MKLDAHGLLRTSCKDCTFATYKDNTQLDCSAEKLNYFNSQDRVIEAYDNEKEFYVIKGFCNFYRKQHWNNGVADKDLARNEIAPTFDIIINCNNITREQQQDIIGKLHGIKYHKNKIKLSLYYNNNQEKNIRSLCLEILAIFQPVFSTTVSVCLDDEEHIMSYIFNKLSSTYFTYVDNTSESLDIDIFEKIEETVNVYNTKILAAKTNTTSVVSSIAYRAYSYENPANNFKENLEKVMELCKEKNMYIEN